MMPWSRPSSSATSRCDRARASSSPISPPRASRRRSPPRRGGRRSSAISDASDCSTDFAAIVSREDVENPKPAPDPFLTAAARLGLAPADCLALEDSYHGIASAHAAGMMAIMVPDLLAATDVVRAQCITVANDLHVVGALLRKARLNLALSASS